MPFVHDLNLHLIRPHLALFVGVFFVAGLILLAASRRLEPAYLALDVWLLKRRRYLWIIGAIGLATLAYSLTADILTYLNYDAYLYDFGFFSQAIWEIAHGGSQVITIGLPTPVPHFLGDHFQPILYLVGAVYALFSSPYTLYAVEVLTIVSGLVPLVKLARRLNGSAMLTIALAAAYCWAPSTLFALAFSFHPLVLLPAILLWIFYLAETASWKWYALAVLLALAVKEDIGYYLACYGLWLAIFSKHKKAGVATALVSLAWSFSAIHYAIPFFRQGPVVQWFVLNPLVSGTGALHPGAWLQVITGSTSKWDMLITGFGSFGFLPLLDPLFLPIYPMFAERLLSMNPNHWAIVYQYGAPLAAAFAYMTLRGISLLNRRFAGLQAAWPGLIVLGLVGSYLGYGSLPADLSKLSRELRSDRTFRLTQATALIPADASVCAQDFTGTHLSGRERVWYLFNVYDQPPKCDYVITDESIQFAPPSLADVTELQDRLNADSAFTHIYSHGAANVWKRR